MSESITYPTDTTYTPTHHQDEQGRRGGGRAGHGGAGAEGQLLHLPVQGNHRIRKETEGADRELLKWPVDKHTNSDRPTSPLLPNPTHHSQNNGLGPEEAKARAEAMGNRRKPDVARPEAWEALRRFEDDEVEVLGGRRLLAELYGLYQAVG